MATVYYSIMFIKLGTAKAATCFDYSLAFGFVPALPIEAFVG